MKKLVALVMALAMCLSMFALTATAEGDVYRFDKQVTLKVSVFDRGATGGTDVTNNAYTKWIQENFGDPRNIKIEWVVIPRSEEVPKLNMLMAGGTAADICFTYSDDVVANFVGQGGLVELTDLIEKYGPHIRSFLGEDVIKGGIFEGRQYALPARRVVLATEGFFIREDWLEELGLPMPTTKEEFYNTLVAFKQAKPDCIPFAIGANLRYPDKQLELSFIKDMDERTLACCPPPMWDGYEDYVVFMNKLYNEGLISPDFTLDTSDLNLKDVSAGKAGVYTYNYDHPIRVSPGILSALQAYEPNAKLTPLDCFESASDPTKYYHVSYQPSGLQCFIPVFSKCPEAAMMYLDWLCEYDTIYFLQNGVEGVTYTLNEDGIPIVNDVEGEYHFNSMQNLDYTLLVNGQYLDQEELLIKAQATSYQGYADLFQPMYEVGMRDLVHADLVHFDRVLPTFAEKNTSLVNYEQEMVAKCVMAKPEDCVELLHTMTKEYMAMGGQAVMEEKLAAWDAMHAGE